MENWYIKNYLLLKILPDLKNSLDYKDYFHLETDRLDLFFVYHENIKNYLEWKDLEYYNSTTELINIVSCVAFIKWTDKQVWFIEFRWRDEFDWKNYWISIPWMFLINSDTQNDIDMRWKWYMKEILLNLIPVLRKQFYWNEIIYSGSSLSDNAIGFFNKLLIEWIVSKSKWIYKYKFNI